MTQLLVFVTDPHCGSTCGLALPEWVDREGVTHKHNRRQAWVWQAWMEAWEWVRSGVGSDPFTLALGGDNTEGTHHRTTEIVTNRVDDHVDMAFDILAPHAEAAENVLMVRGTDCHTGDTETAFARKFGAPLDIEGRSCPDRVEFRIHGTLCAMSHHISTTSRKALEASGESIALAEEQVQAAACGHEPPKVVLRGHRHVMGYHGDGLGLCVVGPAWQLLTRFGAKVVPASRLAVGLIVLDWRGLPEGSVPVVRPWVKTLERSREVVNV